MRVILVTLILVFLAGCGGQEDRYVQYIHGIANIHSDSERPMVGALSLDWNDNLVTASTTKLTRSSSGWQDKSFSLAVPPTEHTSVYRLTAFNDRDDDGLYDDDIEYLGDYAYFLVYDRHRDKWMIVDEDGYIIFEDAEKCSGQDIYIDCVYRRSVSSAADSKVAIARRLMQKYPSQ